MPSKRGCVENPAELGKLPTEDSDQVTLLPFSFRASSFILEMELPGYNNQQPAL
jgi:hypothetical protein